MSSNGSNNTDDHQSSRKRTMKKLRKLREKLNSDLADEKTSLKIKEERGNLEEDKKLGHNSTAKRGATLEQSLNSGFFSDGWSSNNSPKKKKTRAKAGSEKDDGSNSSAKPQQPQVKLKVKKIDEEGVSARSRSGF